MLLVLLLGCSSDVPQVCDTMCQAATDLYGGCLADWGVDWTAIGHADEQAFLASCETWGFEMALLQADAIQRDELSDNDALEDACTQREAAMTADDATCSTYSDIDWNNVPWSL